MVKLLKYAKPYIIIVISAVILLFVQAFCDLNLPNYMADIVNIGIGQNGIVDTVPKAMTEKMYMQFSMGSPEFGEKLNKDYTMSEAGNDEYKDIYKSSATQNIYVLNKDISDEEYSSLTKDFGMAAQMFALISQGTSPQDAMELAKNTDDSLLSQMSTQISIGAYKDLGLDIDQIQRSYIYQKGIIMVLITLLGAAATIMVSFAGARLAAAMSRDIRRDIFVKVEGFSTEEFDKFSTSSLITRTTNDVTQVQMLVIMGFRIIFYAPIMGAGGIIMAVRRAPSISWILGLGIAVLFVLILAIFFIAMPKFKMMQKLIDRLNLVFRENLSGILAVRAFGNQDFESKRFDKANTDLTKTMLFVNRVMVFMFPAMMLIMNVINVLIVWVGADKIAASQMQVGDMMAFMQYAMQVIMAFLMISMMFIMVPRAAVSGDRINEVLSTKPTIVNPEKPKSFDSNKIGYVEFKDVSFKYHGAEEYALKDITFTAKPGETTAFIGSTGSGKSTLINLIPRFYDASEGEVLVNGVDVKDVKQHDLREEIGFVPQKGVLHSGTIASNLRYGKEDATDEEVKKAAEVAQAMEFIETTENGFDKQIAQGGTNVSGGQKQRLSIARALVKNSPIYIFDDTFSALDFKTDAKLRGALKNYTGNATVLIVAQRVSTIMNAEQIIVLNEGEIVGKGTHKELLQNCPTYLEIASSQLSKEEL